MTGSFINSINPIILKNTPVLVSESGATSVTDLTDVTVSNEANGATLVWDTATNSFIVKPLDISEITGTLDGGEF